jgi:hypothetical protein
MTEDINNKVRENVCDKWAEGYLTFTAAGRVFGFATTKGGEPLASTPGSYNASRPIISYSGSYRFEESGLAAKVDLVWDEGWPPSDELHNYRLDGDNRLVENYPPPLSQCVREQNDQHSDLGARIIVRLL